MLEKFNKFCSNIEARIIKEQVENDSFKSSDEIIDELEKKFSLQDLKDDRTLIKKLKRTSDDILEEALNEYYDPSLKNDMQNMIISQIYHYLKEMQK